MQSRPAWISGAKTNVTQIAVRLVIGGVKAQDGFKSLFTNRQTPEDIEEVEITSETPVMRLSNILVEANLASSTSDGMRLIEQGGVKVDGDKVTDKKAELAVGKEYLVQTGKRFFKRVVLKKK